MLDPWREIAQLSRQQTIDLQNRKLHHFINRYVYPFSGAYRKIFDDNHIDPRRIKSIADLARIPLASKADFIDRTEGEGRFRAFVLAPDKEKINRFWPLSAKLPLALTRLTKGNEFLQDQLTREFRPVFTTFTTGTTNMPVPYTYSNYDIQNLYLSGARMLKLFAVNDDDRLVNMFPYAPHLAFWQVVFGGFASCMMVLSSGGGKVMGTEGNIAAIMKMKPAVIIGVPSYVYHVLREAREKGCKMGFLKKVVLGAAKVTEGFKIKLGEIANGMGAKDLSVFGTYGFTESRCAWAECPTSLDVSSGYHLYPDKEIFEVVDPKSGEVKKEGEDGELVYTGLDARGSVVLRYRTGDLVKGGLNYAPCPHCGLRVPRISSDITRLSDVKDLQLSKIKGALVNLNILSAVLSDLPDVEEWQVEIIKRNNDPFDVDELIVNVCAKASCQNKDKLAEDIKKKLALATEVTPNEVRFIDMRDMVKRLEIETANKERRIVDTRPKG